jgi:hypothetical protein
MATEADLQQLVDGALFAIKTQKSSISNGVFSKLYKDFKSNALKGGSTKPSKEMVQSPGKQTTMYLYYVIYCIIHFNIQV